MVFRCTCSTSAAKFLLKVEADPIPSDIAIDGERAIRIRQYYDPSMRLNAAAGYPGRMG
jgi:hypothetical protein